MVVVVVMVVVSVMSAQLMAVVLPLAGPPCLSSSSSDYVFLSLA